MQFCPSHTFSPTDTLPRTTFHTRYLPFPAYTWPIPPAYHTTENHHLPHRATQLDCGFGWTHLDVHRAYTTLPLPRCCTRRAPPTVGTLPTHPTPTHSMPSPACYLLLPYLPTAFKTWFVPTTLRYLHTFRHPTTPCHSSYPDLRDDTCYLSITYHHQREGRLVTARPVYAGYIYLFAYRPLDAVIPSSTIVVLCTLLIVVMTVPPSCWVIVGQFDSVSSSGFCGLQTFYDGHDVRWFIIGCSSTFLLDCRTEITDIVYVCIVSLNALLFVW